MTHDIASKYTLYLTYQSYQVPGNDVYLPEVSAQLILRVVASLLAPYRAMHFLIASAL